jgi:nickel/cobalt transporter (NicO) family protein
MRRAIGVAVVLVGMWANPGAHQLDEYLQASRLSFAHHRITLEIDLTPGVAVAPAVIAQLDSNGDRTTSPHEARAYGQSVLSDVVMTLDGRPIAVTLERVEVPSNEELRDGVGTIQLRAAGPAEGRGSGRRQLHFRNNHRPDVGVYLVNALRSEERAVHVVHQSRDRSQRQIEIEYSVDPDGLIQAVGLVAGGAALAVLVYVRRRRPVAS